MGESRLKAEKRGIAIRYVTEERKEEKDERIETN